MLLQWECRSSLYRVEDSFALKSGPRLEPRLETSFIFFSNQPTCALGPLSSLLVTQSLDNREIISTNFYNSISERKKN